MRWLSILVTLSGLFLGLGAQASKCYCNADPYSKTYEEKDGVVNKWWGGKRAWSCVYTCNTPKGEMQIRARHRKTYVGSDNGLWGICDGLIYQSQYSTFKNDFVYMLEGSEGLDPAKSTSSDLVHFADQYCK